MHTGQNYDKRLNDVFFKQLKVRAPDHVIVSKSDTAMDLFGDGRANRGELAGTVARGWGEADDSFYRGLDAAPPSLFTPAR